MDEREWLHGSEIGISIWEKKYRYNNESFEEFLDRVSGGDGAVRRLIADRKFLFGGRILSNRGLPGKVTLSNCYVIAPPEDNIESIFECAAKLARTFSFGGGCGIDIGKLRPSGAIVNNSARQTSGATSFMDLYSTVTSIIGQNGRRGALMISIPCYHPDLEQFIKIKSDLTKVTSANISVRVTGEFMKAVEADEEYVQSFLVEDTGELVEKTVKARELFNLLCEVNMDYGEPGMLFWDRIKHWNLLSNTDGFEFAGTNPCGEQPLPAGGSCLLGALNLAEFVEDGEFEYDSFSTAVYTAVKALNDVLDEGLPKHPLLEQRESVRDWRQIGLGIMGLADMLIKMKIRYGSDESIDLCNDIASFMMGTAFVASVTLGVRDGSFPKFVQNNITSTDFYKANLDPIPVPALRNSQLLTVAPTGSTSTMFGVSGGIEPIFANTYTRKTESLHGEEHYYEIVTPIVQEYFDSIGAEYDVAKLPDYFITAREIDYLERIRMQATWQSFIDASISSTINVPNSFTANDIAKLYTEAYSRGLKGVTVFREGCKRAAVLSTDGAPKPEEELKRGEIIKVDSRAVGRKRSLNTGCGTLHCVAFFNPDTGELVETYLSKGSTGGCNNFMVGLSRLISLAARGGIDIHDIVDQLQSAGACPSYAVRSALKHDTSPGASCPVAIGNALLDMYKSTPYTVTKVRQDIDSSVPKSEEVPANVCPTCGAELVFEGGCNCCKMCGYSKCD